MPKIVCFADVHIGVSSYGEIDPETGLNSRVINGLEALDSMINYTIENKIKYMICAGDIYHNNLPSPTLQDEFNKRVKRISDNNIKLYILSGNHDVSKMRQMKSPLTSFDTLDVKNVYHTRFKGIQYIDNKLKLLFMPTYTNQEEVEQILEEECWEEIPTLVILHESLLNAEFNDWLLVKNEQAIDTNIFKRPNIIGCICGHLHKYQILNNAPLTLYTGSLQRIDFTEETQEKGFTVLNIKGNKITHEFVELPSQKFYTLKLDIRDEKIKEEILNEQFQQSIIDDKTSYIINELEKDNEKLTDSIARVLLDMNINDKIDEKLILDKINEFGVTKMVGISKNIYKPQLTRNINMTGDISVLEALKLYFKDYEDKEKYISMGEKIITKALKGEI